MYTHELAAHGPYTVLHHFKERAIGSTGIVALNELGHTVAVVEKSPDDHAHSGLVAPCRLGITQPYSQIPGTSIEQVHCPDLDDFVRTGIKKWQDLVSRLGSVAKIDVQLVEIAETKETVTASGLVVVDSSQPATSSFKSYAANPDEIIAMERIARSVRLNSRATGSLPGSSQYL